MLYRAAFKIIAALIPKVKYLGPMNILNKLMYAVIVFKITLAHIELRV
mgnify:CR=1 FL=1